MKWFLGIFLCSGVVAHATSLSLQDALDLAKAGNSKIKAEKAKVEIAESGRDEARARFMPTVSLTAGITRINDPISIDLSRLQEPLGSVAGAAAYSKAYIDAYNKASDGYAQAYAGAIAKGLSEEQAKATAEKLLGGTPRSVAQQNAEAYGANATKSINETDFSMRVQDEWFFNARLSVVWPIFTGLKIYSAYDAAKENVEARKAEFEMAQNAILMDVAVKYFMLRLAEELTVMRESTKHNLENHLERSRKLEEGGQISKAERLRAEVALAEAENAYEDALRDQSLARMALASLLHTDTTLTTITPVEAPQNTRSMEEFKELALEKHPGLRQLRTERKRSQNAIRAARADYFPTVALFGYKELYTRDLTILEPEWAVGARLQWDIFKGGDTRSKVSSAKSMDRSLMSLEEETMDNLKLLVEKRWRELEHARGRLTSLLKTRELANEALRSQNRAYEAGLATGLDVVDAELALSRLQVADLKAHFDAVIAWLGLLEAAGEVAEAGSILQELVKAEPVHATVSEELAAKVPNADVVESAVKPNSASANAASSSVEPPANAAQNKVSEAK